jgi:hypothetical protein
MPLSHHIIVASEQLWPNLLGLALLKKRDGGLASLHIIHTSDDRRSRKPAQSLQQLASQMGLGLADGVTLWQTGGQAQEVFSTLQKILSGLPSDEKPRTMNATGGTKQIFAGLVPWVASVETFYLEVSGDWFHLKHGTADGSAWVISEPWPEVKDTRVDLPVPLLAKTQVESTHDTTWEETALPTPRELDPAEVIHQGCGNGWDWTALGAHFPALMNKSHGVQFEVLFGALLTACGARQGVLQLKYSTGGTPRQEYDAVVSTGTRLIVFDLKLMPAGEPAKIDQLTRLAQDKRTLGGLGATAVAVRPTWEHDQSLADLCRDVLQVQLWTQKDMPQLISLLLKQLQQPALDENHTLWAAHQTLLNAGDTQQRLFSKPRALQAHPTVREERRGWLNLDAYRSDANQPAVTAEFPGYLMVHLAVNQLGWTTVDDIRRALPSGIKCWYYVHFAKAGRSAVLFLAADQENMVKIKEWITNLKPTGP